MSQSKKSRLFIIVLLAMSLMAPVFPFVRALTEFVDDYQNEDYIAIKERIVRNPNLNAMELNISIDKGRYEVDGYFYTVEILSNIISLSNLMTNSTLDSGTISVQFSDDNSTWVDHNNQPGQDYLIEGYESIDLRDLDFTKLYMRFDLTRGGFFKTPRLYQIIIIYGELIFEPQEAGGDRGGESICVPQFFNASSISVITGTLNDGNLASTYFMDGDWYNVSEVVGPPGLDIRVNFTGVGVGCGCFEFYQMYVGHSQHEVEVQVWNFTATAWNTIGPVFYNETANWACIGLGHTYEHFFDGGELLARFYHEDRGHVVHELQIDRIDLAVVHAEECSILDPVDDYSVIFLAIGVIMCLAIAFLYVKNR